MAPVTNIADLRDIARRRIPRSMFEYAQRGSYDERTLAANTPNSMRSACASV